MRKVSVLLLWLWLVPCASGQEPASVSGFVTDRTTGETLLLANVVLEGTAFGTATNTSGYYTLTGIPPGDYTLATSFIGYRLERVSLTLAPGETRRVDIALAPEGYAIDEVTVTAERELDAEARRVGAAQLQTEVIRSLPAVLEPDVFRALQLLPGVKAASDYSSGLYIRGGSPDQTLILLDRTTVYNPTHFFGFFSTFNPDAIKDVRLYKGAFPASYGGRLGSVVDIYNKDGNRVRHDGSVSAGLLASRAMAEGPHRWGSWMVAVRRSTLEPLLAALRSADVDGLPERFYFYDVNAKLNVDLSADDRVSASIYGGHDALRIAFLGDAVVDLTYGNRTFSGNWTHVFSRELFSNFTVTASSYYSEPDFTISGTTFEQRNRVDDGSLKGDFEFLPAGPHSFRAGFWAGHFGLGFLNRFDAQVTLDAEIDAAYGALYAQHTYAPGPRWEVRTGVRVSGFEEGGYVRVGPRLSVEHRPVERLRLQAAYGRYHQYLTLITSEIFSGFDAWLPTGEGVPPAYGDQFVLGVKATPRPGHHVDAELYYRTMRRLFEFDPFLQDVAGLPYEQLFHFGDGHAYGFEILLQRQVGRLNGFLGYTLGRTRRRFALLNEGRSFPPKYDRTHDVNLVVNYDLTRRWRLTGVYTFATGQAYTEPHGKFELDRYPFGQPSRDVLVSAFNADRLPPYHRLDLGATNRGRFFGFADYELQLQVVNAYSRRNVWFYVFQFERDDSVTRTTVPQIPVPIPNVSLTLNF